MFLYLLENREVGPQKRDGFGSALCRDAIQTRLTQEN